MFGRKQDGSDGQDGSNGDNRDGDDAATEKTSEGTAPAAPEGGDEPISSLSFAEGIRQDVPRPRPRGRGAVPEDEPKKAEPKEAVSPAAEPQEAAPAEPPLGLRPTLAVPPPAGGAGRAAAYRTAPLPDHQEGAKPAPAPTPTEAATPPETATPPEPAPPTEPAKPTEEAMDMDDSKKLIVGRGISLKGEISECDALIVEGNVEVSLSDSRSITVGESGVFKGTVEVDEATIAGEFDGKLVARKVLTIQSSGRVRGEIRYGALQVEPGGLLAGTIDATSDAPAADAPRATFGQRETPTGDDA